MADLRVSTRISAEVIANAIADMGEAEASDFARDLFDELKAIDEDIAAAVVGSMMDAADMGVA
jgi:hypothetical protein